jgi:predicted nucleotidyltransferase
MADLKRESLDGLCRAHGVLALYLFGSRAKDGLHRLAGEPVSGEGSDLDIGAVFTTPHVGHRRLNLLQVELEEIFTPLRVDLVLLHAVDPLIQFAGIDGERVAVTDTTAADLFELDVMRRAAELLPIERAIERDTFGVASR